MFSGGFWHSFVVSSGKERAARLEEVAQSTTHGKLRDECCGDVIQRILPEYGCNQITSSYNTTDDIGV